VTVSPSSKNARLEEPLDWFEESFGEDYLSLYPHRDETEAERVIELIAARVAGVRVHRALDLACGAGRHSRLLGERWWTVGLDLSRALLRVAKKESPDAPFVRADMRLLLTQWEQIAAKAGKAKGPMLLYREPELAVRVIREEFNVEYRRVVIDDHRLHEDVKAYVAAFNPELADRIEYYDPAIEGLSLFEHHRVHEQVHKALDRKVWLPSGGSLIIEHTEALTVIDVNTGKNVGTSSLEETVFHNNMEAAEEIAKQLRLRDIGGIIVIDFIDMEIRDNRDKVVEVFRNALARDKTRSQVFAISELGLVEMTRKRIGEGLLTEFSTPCEVCEGRGVIVDHALLD